MYIYIFIWRGHIMAGLPLSPRPRYGKHDRKKCFDLFLLDILDCVRAPNVTKTKGVPGALGLGAGAWCLMPGAWRLASVAGAFADLTYFLFKRV